MAVQAHGDLSGRQGKISIDKNFQPVIMAVQTVSTRSLGGRKVQKSMEDRFRSIPHDLHKRLSSTLERGRPHLTRAALNEEQRPVGNCMGASSNVYGPPRKGIVHLGSSIAILKNRLQQGIMIDSYTLVDVLKRCSEQKNLIAARQVHDLVIQSGMEKHRYVATTLIGVYIKCGRLQDAHRVFDGLERTNRTVITWNVMIGAYAKRGYGMEAFRLFLQMRREAFIPDAFTYASILNPSASRGALEWVKQVHGHARKAGLESELRVGSALVRMYAKSGSMDDARVVFDRMEKRDVITWNIMIGAYAESGYGMEAYRLFLQMKREGFMADAYTYASILNPSASPGALEWVKEVHGHVRKAGLESDLRVGSALVHMYAKSGSIDDARVVFDRMEKRDVITWNIMIGAYAENGGSDDARLVFDRMEERDVITWNIMIGAYAESGCGMEAYELFLQMKREGFRPDAITFLNILNASASAGALEWVTEVHSHVLKAGLESDLRVGNALVHMYARSGSIDDARLVFDRMEKRDVITWNIMIGAYAESGCGMEAYQLFLQMIRKGFIPDAYTYASILNPSANPGALEWVKEVHGHARKAGLESDLRVGNALVHVYAKSGSMDDARVVFDRMEKRDVITWNILIGAYAESGCGMEAYRLFLQMKREGFIPDAITFLNILNASASAGALEWVKEVHSHVLNAGLESDLRVGNAVVHMYAKSGSIDDAQVVFDRMEKRDVITGNIMIGAYAENGRSDDARLVFDRMEKRDVITWNTMIGAYAENGRSDDARLVFDRMEKRDVITWNIMIGAYAESGCGMEAYRLFLQMKREGFTPDAITFLNILNASASAGALEWVKEVHSDVLEAGLESDVRVDNALVHMYAKSGSIDDARVVFDRMQKRNAVTWNTMIGGLALHGCGDEALKLFKEMIAACVEPDETSFVAVLSACSHAGLVDDGRRIFSAMMKDYGFNPTVVHYNCMVDILGRAGLLEEAKLLIDKMPLKADAGTWRALLGACRTFSNVELGEFAAKEVLKLEPKDAAAYVLLSNIYAAAGKWEEVSSVRTMMQERGVRKEPGCSWIEVDNKIHEFLVGDTSHPEAKAIYSELKKLTEQLKARGYTPDTKLVLHNFDEEEKELSLCSHSEKLAIAYGLLRVPRGKPIRVKKNLRVCSDCHGATKLISEVTGREIIVRDANRFHHFKDGLCSCGDYW